MKQILTDKKNKKKWVIKDLFLEKLKNIQESIKLYKQDSIQYIENNKKCKYCDKYISNKIYTLNNYNWENNVIHCVNNHNIIVNEKFVEFIMDFDIEDYFSIKLSGDISNNFLKLDKNQILILDALMKHGGYSKKYYDTNMNIIRFSEHAGYLEMNNKIVKNIVVSGNTDRVDKDDNVIFYPKTIKLKNKFNYIFHTHPPTPRPGGRVDEGIIYEFPGSDDLLYFIDHYNKKNIIGSLVMTSEGLYNIRTIKKIDKLIIDENKLYKMYSKLLDEIHNKTIKKYGEKFNTNFFYSKIAQNTEYIDIINEYLNKFLIHIDFFSRIKDKQGKWFVDTVYLLL